MATVISNKSAILDFWKKSFFTKLQQILLELVENMCFSLK